MNLKNRLAKLEAVLRNKTQRQPLSIFIVSPGIEPIGYVCDGMEIIRKPDETVEALEQRCVELVKNDGKKSHLFFVMGDKACH